MYWHLLQCGSRARGTAASNHPWWYTASFHASRPTPASSSPSLPLPHDGEGITCFVPSARNDLCRWVKTSLCWDQSCLMSNHSMGRAPMATSIHGAFHSKGQSKQLLPTVLMDRTLLCTAHLTDRRKSSLIRQVFISGNTTRVWIFFFPPKMQSPMLLL